MKNYKKYVKKIVEKVSSQLGLVDYDIVISYNKDEEAQNRGQCFPNKSGKVATLSLHEKYVKEAKKSEVKRLMIHELLELRMHDIRYHMSEFYSNNMIAEEIHKVIRPLEKLICKI
jgi:hypothetical protein